MKQSGRKLHGRLCFFLLLLYTLFGKVTDKYFPINGVTAEKERSKATVKSIFDGTYQQDMSQYMLSAMPGRDLLVKTHNQVLYSVFHVSSNRNNGIVDTIFGMTETGFPL